MQNKLEANFFERDILKVAPELLGKVLVIYSNSKSRYYPITEVEAYRGEEDLACHASKGKTNRTKVMYQKGGILYIYLIYGMYWMLNIVTGSEDLPQAALIRGVEGISGPGRLTKALGIDKSFNGESLITSQRIWILDAPKLETYCSSPRIGIDYAGDYWKNKDWRFFIPD